MDSAEILEWYDIACCLMEEEFDEQPWLIVTDVFYWADELYNNMDRNTKELSKVK